MSTYAFAGLARETLEEEVKLVEQGILGGTASWDEYNKLVGKRRGLLLSLDTIDDVMRRFDEQD